LEKFKASRIESAAQQRKNEGTVVGGREEKGDYEWECLGTLREDIAKKWSRTRKDARALLLLNRVGGIR
jgi:hypothetical protein